MTITAFPLAWPPGWKRTAADERAYGRFSTAKQSSVGNWRTTQNITVAAATQRLRAELDRMAVRGDDLVLSSNLKLRLDGLPRSDQAQPADPGAAVCWNDPWTAAPRCMAIDRYTKVEMNIAALAATIEAMRAIERHGGAIVLERAFAGFTALPAPIVAGMKRHWREVLGFSSNYPVSAELLKERYRSRASSAHPDKGGSTAEMAELNQVRDDALKEIS
ncbi:chaperone DnaJ domain-containing protein [Variovorax paradoxus B4]|uniref:Chaperone DnaJ domain-containing protein n=1 Tax=Variovorax paradoxus B4 TaxID=1246301 RepID=T1XAB1_VARPD|nr:molecular chaperone DnaJ [Variovorax paradoxus]AGU49080.1 chaperone DnaJ domain-containing protein [Variovorax paradoxus B4]